MKRSVFVLTFLVVVGMALAGCGGQKPPKADITSPSDSQAFTSASVSFEGKALDDANKEVTKDVEYEWDFGDGGSAKGKSATHDYTAGGDYKVKFTVKTAAQAKDSKAKLDAKQTKEITIKVTLNQAPTVGSITATPAQGPAPLEVSFSADAANDPEGKALTYAWDFGDGQTGSDAAPTHKFEAAGTYNVTLTVSDEDGGKSNPVSTTVTVEGGSAPMTSEAVEVHMMGTASDFQFMPKELKIKAGTKVRFVNKDGVHTATAYADKIPAGATAFDSGVITAVYAEGAECTAANGCYEVEFTVAGTYEYKCIPHEALGMVGKIEVEP
jgi:PKD repeat protein